MKKAYIGLVLGITSLCMPFLVSASTYVPLFGGATYNLIDNNVPPFSQWPTFSYGTNHTGTFNTEIQFMYNGGAATSTFIPTEFQVGTQVYDLDLNHAVVSAGGAVQGCINVGGSPGVPVTITATSTMEWKQLTNTVTTASYPAGLIGNNSTNRQVWVVFTETSNCAGGSLVTPYDVAPSQLFGVSTTSAQTYCQTNFPNAVTYGVCSTLIGLFVPSSDSLINWVSLQDTLVTKFPFSYINSVINVFDNLQASSTQNSPEIKFNLHDLGIGSTSPIGNVLPNVTVFSSSTVEQYFGNTAFDLLKGLAAIAIILTLVADIFFTTRNLLHHDN